MSQNIKHHNTRTTAFVTVAITFFFIGLAVRFYETVLINENGLKALIEAEATILGFFGLMVVYILTSFDTRIDRLERQIFDLHRKHKEEADKNENLRDNVRKLKRDVVQRSRIVGAMLIISLLICIYVLGIQNIYVEALSKETLDSFAGIMSVMGTIAILLFFESLWLIFDLFRMMQE